MDELVSLTKAQVPKYLVGSEFYNSLSADDEEEFSIPQKFLKPNVNVNSGAELAHLFHTMKFWGMMKLPDNIIELILFKSRAIPDYEARPIRDVLVEFDAEFKLPQLFDTLPMCSSAKQRCDSAAQCGREDVLEYVLRVHGQVNAVTIKAIAEHGFLQFLQRASGEFVSELGVPSRKYPQPLLPVAVILIAYTCCWRMVARRKNLLAALPPRRSRASMGVHGCAWNTAVADLAANNGHLDFLKYAIEHSSAEQIADTACAAAEGGQVECLQCVLDQGVIPTRRMCYAACVWNRLGCLQLLLARGAPWDVVCQKSRRTWVPVLLAVPHRRGTRGVPLLAD